MKYSPDTIRAVRDYSLAQGTSYALGEIEDILRALESTDEQKALRTFEKTYVKWAMTPGGGLSEGDAFVELVEAYDVVLKAREA